MDLMSHKASAVIHKDDSHSLSGSFYDANQIADSLKSTGDRDESKFNFLFSHNATLLKHALISLRCADVRLAVLKHMVKLTFGQKLPQNHVQSGFHLAAVF